METIVLKGHFVDTPALGELRTLERGFLILEDGVIQGLYPRLPEAFSSCPVVDYGDRLVMQSFADMHLHAPQYPMVGMGMDLPLLDWLHSYTFPAEARFADREFARKTYRCLARELIARGTTRVCMFSSLHTDATLILMEELEKAGVCGLVGKVNMDRNGVPELQETTEDSQRETLRWLEACQDFPHVKPVLTPRFTPSCTDRLMSFLGGLAAERGLPVQSHLSENTAEMELVALLHPDCKQYWETYAKFGLWNHRTVMAHCVWSDARERAAMREAGVLAVHCAASNVNICSGTAPVRAMLDEGVQVALGTDIAGGDSPDMADAVTMAIRASKVRRIDSNWQEDFLTVAEGYYLGSVAGHQWLGGGAGFQPGARLHALVLEDSALPHVRPLSLRERFERSLYRRQPHAVRAVWSDGRLVLDREAKAQKD